MDGKKFQIIKCKDKNEASKKAFEILLQNVDPQTLLLLSGGTSPDSLYQLIVQEKSLKPGVIALIDERFGLPMHDNSNEKMIKQTGLLNYINNVGIPFYGILKGKDMETTAWEYEETIKGLFKKYPKKVAIMGIGADGHTAGIKPDLDYDHSKSVVAYDDAEGPFGKRITLTFKALSQINEFIVLAFGENKKIALQESFQEKDQKVLPAVFYIKTSANVRLLTDIIIS